MALHLGPAFRRAGKAQAAIHFPAGRKPRLGLQVAIKPHGFAQELGDAGGAAQLADKPGGMESAARGELRALQQRHLPAQFGEVIGGRTADDAAADNDRAGLGGECHGRN